MWPAFRLTQMSCFGGPALDICTTSWANRAGGHIPELALGEEGHRLSAGLGSYRRAEERFRLLPIDEAAVQAPERMEVATDLDAQASIQAARAYGLEAVRSD